MAAKRYAAISFGHFRWSYGHAEQWVRLPAWGLRLVFYSNHGQKMHRFDVYTTAWDRQTDRQTDGRIAAVLNVSSSREPRHYFTNYKKYLHLIEDRSQTDRVAILANSNTNR